MKKVSVIVPVYNSEAYLNDLLSSLVNQKMQDIEIILIDDASLDCSRDIMQSWEKKYPDKIRVFYNDANLGQGASRNIGLKYAKGEYVSFVDSDDFIHPDMYFDMYNDALLNGMPNIVTSRIVFAKEDATYQDYFKTSRRKGVLVDLKKEPYTIIYESPSCGNKLFKRSFIKNSSFLVDTMWEDAAFTYSHMFLAEKIVVSHNPDYYYRKHQNTGVSAQGFRVNMHLMDIFKVAAEIENQCIKNGCYDYFKEEIKVTQVASCLYRIREVLTWNIDHNLKMDLIRDLYRLVQAKYGDINELNQDYLSMKVDFHTLDVVRQVRSDILVEQAEENIQRTLSLLKA